MPESPVLVATVTVVFGASAGRAGPEAVASGLLEHEDVSTVRINAHGCASGYRVDVAGPSLDDAAGRATALAAEVADRLDLSADVLSVGLTRDEDRREVFRIGERGEELVWGERMAQDTGVASTQTHDTRATRPADRGERDAP